LKLGELPFHPYEPIHLVADTHLAQSMGWMPRTNLAYAVWELAQTQFPELAVTKPAQYLDHRTRAGEAAVLHANAVRS